ncbi:hypothetical protein Bbelb_017850 [Branchiostoma belcheri]|nr:hypothetical protein Bbelb_017850 [Branchiostoma belcheri]
MLVGRSASVREAKFVTNGFKNTHIASPITFSGLMTQNGVKYYRMWVKKGNDIRSLPRVGLGASVVPPPGDKVACSPPRHTQASGQEPASSVPVWKEIDHAEPYPGLANLRCARSQWHAHKEKPVFCQLEAWSNKVTVPPNHGEHRVWYYAVSLAVTLRAPSALPSQNPSVKLGRLKKCKLAEVDSDTPVFVDALGDQGRKIGVA